MKLIPQPKSVNELPGAFSLTSLTAVSIAPGTDRRVAALCRTVADEAAIYTKNRVTVRYENASAGTVNVSHGSSAAEPIKSDGYTLKITPDAVEVFGNGASGAFYALQTLRQLIKTSSGSLKCCVIEDEPDFSIRGFYHDITRGRVPTLEKLYEIADFLSFYKINHLELYVEDCFDFAEYEGILTPSDKLTAEEIAALDTYCHERFIELVPSLSCFGHLYNLLSSDRYSHLCELADYKPTSDYWIEKMRHHTIDVSNPESAELIFSLIDQYAPLFRSDKFNICCDETFDLCRGRNLGKDAGEEYFGFVRKIIDHLNSMGKTVLMWGDIALNHPDKLSVLPKGTVMLNWDYSECPAEQRVKAFYDASLCQIVCPGTSTWNRFSEYIECSEKNISRLASNGKKYGAEGILNTNWGDFGNICSFNCSLYSTVLGAQKGWNEQAETDDDYKKAFGQLVYGVADTEIYELLKQVGQYENACTWQTFVELYSNTVFGHANENKPTFNTSALQNAIDSLEKIMLRAKKLLQENNRLREFLIACRGMILLDKAALRINGEPCGNLSQYAEDFIRDYREMWLKYDKPSQIDLITGFIKNIISM